MTEDIDCTVQHRHNVTLRFDTERDLQTFTEFLHIVERVIDNGSNTLEEVIFIEWREDEGRFQQELELIVNIGEKGV